MPDKTEKEDSELPQAVHDEILEKPKKNYGGKIKGHLKFYNRDLPKERLYRQSLYI